MNAAHGSLCIVHKRRVMRFVDETVCDATGNSTYFIRRVVKSKPARFTKKNHLLRGRYSKRQVAWMVALPANEWVEVTFATSTPGGAP